MASAWYTRWFFPVALLLGTLVFGDNELRSLNSPAQACVERAVNHLYNYRFPQALGTLDTCAVIDSLHPVSPFLKMATMWLYTQAEFGYDSSYAVIETGISELVPRYERWIKQYPDDPEYRLYLASTYGMRERIALAQKHWLDIIKYGYRAHRIIQNVHRDHPQLLDALLPLGIMEYYACKSPRTIRFLASLLGIEPECDLGLNHLKRAALEAPFSWIEASNVLTYAYLYLEKEPEVALHWITPLTEKYPGHPFFAYLRAEALAKAGRWTELAEYRPVLLSFIDTGPPFLQNECQLKLAYIDALHSFAKRDYQSVLRQTTWVIENYEMEFDWLLGFAHLLRGKVMDLQGRRADAEADYRITADLDNRYPEVDEARRLLKIPFTLDP